MNYEKLTPESFTAKLKNNQYESLTGSRRAIGKASWPEADKEKARAQALKFFGDNGTPAKKAPAKKTATKKAPAAKTAAVKAVKAKAGRKPAAPVQGEKMEPKAPPIGQEHYTEVLARAKNVTMADVRKNPHAIIQLATHGVQAGTSVLNTLAALKEKDPSLNISDSVDAANGTVKASLHLTSLVLDSLSEGIEGRSHEKVTIETKPETASTNGVAAPGTPTYEAPTAATTE